VSVTTRQRRPSEIDGTHYHFIDEVSFLQRRDQGALLEWAEVHGNFYGTPREPVERALSQGHIMLFDIDWQGTEQVRAAMPDDTVTVLSCRRALRSCGHASRAAPKTSPTSSRSGWKTRVMK
jgi:guanylate kinase